jgi:hypothetical protein
MFKYKKSSTYIYYLRIQNLSTRPHSHLLTLPLKNPKSKHKKKSSPLSLSSQQFRPPLTFDITKRFQKYKGSTPFFFLTKFS